VPALLPVFYDHCLIALSECACNAHLPAMQKQFSINSPQKRESGFIADSRRTIQPVNSKKTIPREHSVSIGA
jgi:hypothetical protein